MVKGRIGILDRALMVWMMLDGVGRDRVSGIGFGWCRKYGRVDLFYQLDDEGGTYGSRFGNSPRG